MKSARLITSLILSSVLAGCYIVPAGPNSPIVRTSPSTAAPVHIQPTSLHAKLYPTNSTAQRYGTVTAAVTTDQNGHGSFQTFIGGETFNGDATRTSGSRTGRANGSAPSGRYIACTYEMNSSQLGSGTCQLSDGATFSIHIGR